jgi:hypothetical protein
MLQGTVGRTKSQLRGSRPTAVNQTLWILCSACSRRRAEPQKRGIVIEDASDLEKIENIRSSLFPEPQQIDVRRMQMQLGVNLSGGLSEEALAEIERLCKIL